MVLLILCLHKKTLLGIIMRSFPAVCAATFLLAAVLPSNFAAAAEPQPTGEWHTANGLANVRIDDCNGILWGIISWEKEAGVDSYNPDPAERGHPTLGLHILRAMKPTKPGLWQGEVYNPENGKTYDSRISLEAPDTLRIEGCVLGFLCGGESWARVKAADAVTVASQRPPAPRPAGKPKESKDAPPPASLTACSGLPAAPK